jgi:REP element-mobilizing transposase RayT
MSGHLKRYYGHRHSHFITCSCYRRQALFAPHSRKDLFLVILEPVRKRYEGFVFGYVVMPGTFTCC